MSRSRRSDRGRGPAGRGQIRRRTMYYVRACCRYVAARRQFLAWRMSRRARANGWHPGHHAQHAILASRLRRTTAPVLAARILSRMNELVQRRCARRADQHERTGEQTDRSPQGSVCRIHMILRYHLCGGAQVVRKWHSRTMRSKGGQERTACREHEVQDDGGHSSMRHSSGSTCMPSSW
jgi:hypothetical protein